MLDSLLGNLAGMVYCCLLDHEWTMLFVSEGCFALTGYAPADLLYNHRIGYERITHAADRAAARRVITEAVAAGDNFDVEYRIVHADGSIRWVWERGSALRNERGEAEAIEGFIQDISERKHSETAARAAEERYRSIFENAIEGIYQTTPDGRYLNFNPALARIYGFESADALRQGITDIEHQLYVEPGKRAEFMALMEATGVVRNFEAQVYRNDGDIIWIAENARAVRDAEGRLLFYEGTVEDITERKHYEQRIAYQATHDSLTGLPNRAMLNDRLQQCMHFAERYGGKVALAFIDLDEFKLINDGMGHDFGDRLLVVMAQRLAEGMRKSDTLVRLGGDEFVMLLGSVQKVEDIVHSMRRVLASVAEPCSIDGREFIVSCSIGIALYPDDGRDPTTLLKHADTAMYKAKHSGRNNFQFYTSELNQALTQRLETEYRLRRAIEHGQLRLHYQPKLDLASARICGAEALLRWQAEDGSMIPPMAFIPVAEESGLIEDIGRWVLLAACTQARQLEQNTGRMLPVAVNVSPRQFRQPGLVQSVADALACTGLAPHLLELEITETTLVHDTRHFTDTLKHLKALGVKLAIDDFGTGYSSMAYLKDFPVDRLKIDKAFVAHLESEPTNVAILKAIVALGHGLGVKVVAEGVETDYQRAFLHGIGCDEMQGYLYSRPLPEQAFAQLVRAEGSTAAAGRGATG